MATLDTKWPNLIDLAKQLDPSGRMAKLAEILNETNEILTDMVWMEGNLLTGHLHTVRTGLPDPTWRKLYGGVQPTKGTTAQVTDNTGMLEAYAEVDKALADLNGNTREFRLRQDRAHIEGISQELARAIFYGNEGSLPESFTGLSPRYNTRNTATAANAANVIHGGSADTDNASIWLVGWGDTTVFGIVPKGSQAGLQINDKGQVTIENVDGLGGRMEAYRTHYRQDAGLAVEDWRYVVRIANIEKSALTYNAATGANLPNLMFEALEMIPSLGAVRPVFYMSRDIRTKVRQQSAALTGNSTLTIDNVGGTIRVDFHGIPLRIVDQLSADEALVPA